MATLFDFFRRHSVITAWISALVIGILLSQSPIGFKLSIAGIFVDTIYKPYSIISTGYHTLRDRREENLRLKEELITTRFKLESLKEAQRENQRLRRALGFAEEIEYYTILAEVVGRGTPRMPSSIMVNAGAAQGVVVGLPVIDESGVVGKILSVYNNSSVVQFINDPNSRISALDARSRVQGIISSKSGGQLIMENVPLDADIRQGDAIISSGLGGIFPTGLLIGRIKRVSIPQSGLFSIVEISPAAELSILEEVFIIFPFIRNKSAKDSLSAKVE